MPGLAKGFLLFDDGKRMDGGAKGFLVCAFNHFLRRKKLFPYVKGINCLYFLRGRFGETKGWIFIQYFDSMTNEYKLISEDGERTVSPGVKLE